MTNHLLRKTAFILLALYLLSLPAVAMAQMFPAVLIEDDDTGEVAPLRMTELSIDISVIANIATTTMSMTFYNDLDRVLEGNLYFPLGEGQTVSRFAMTVDGKLREGVVVEKAKGRAVFDSIVRQEIDPGLLEWTKGNNFKANIYPIPEKGHKKIVIAFEQELTDSGKGFLYVLPLSFKDRVDLFTIRAEIFKQNIKPGLFKNEIDNFKFKKWHESYVAEAEVRNYLPNRQLAFSLPKEKDRQRIFIEKDSDNEDQSYFYISVDPELKKASKTLPERVCLLWDASGSAASRDIKKELTVLKKYFKKLGGAKVHVVLFANEIILEKDFNLKKNKKGLFNFLENVNYDGGTQLGALDLTNYKCDEFILASDGLSNVGESYIRLSKTPVVVLNSSQSANHSYLRYISQATGGVYINLNKLTKKQAVESISTQTYSFISAAYDERSIKETYPRISTPVNKDFSISGILQKDNAEITLNFGFGKDVKYSKTIKLGKAGHSIENSLIKRIWAQKKIAELDMRYKENREELTEFGKEMNIVTRNTSLIVLDRIEDYVMHRILPPEDMRKEYFEILNEWDSEDAEYEKEHLEDVVEWFEEQVKWWNTEYPLKGTRIKDINYRDYAGNFNPGAEYEDYYVPVHGGGGGGISDDEEEFTLEEIVVAEEHEPESADPSKIKLANWEPDTPYLTKLRKSRDEKHYEVYLKLKDDYKDSSAFYLDAANFFIDKKDNVRALRILSNIAEMELENHQLLRILGYRLMQLGCYKLAIAVFEDVQEIREEEPQTYRDLALAYAADKQFQKAVDMLYHIVTTYWDDRFEGIELVALNEMNAIIAKSDIELNLDNIDKRLLKNLPVDIRVVLTWDADMADMDLWVIDPLGEKCFYGNQETYIGGLNPFDFTGGYGPEVYLLKEAKPGKYEIKVQYYGNYQQSITGPTTIQATFFTNFGKPDEKKKAIIMRLEEEKEFIDVGEFIFNNK